MYRTNPRTAARGADKIQAQMMLRIVPHLTAFFPRVNPIPINVPLAIWVELIGIPKKAADPKIIELDRSLENPWYGRIRVIFVAIVFTILQPPKTTPDAIAMYEALITQNGTTNSEM